MAIRGHCEICGEAATLVYSERLRGYACNECWGRPAVPPLHVVGGDPRDLWPEYDWRTAGDGVWTRPVNPPPAEPSYLAGGLPLAFYVILAAAVAVAVAAVVLL